MKNLQFTIYNLQKGFTLIELLVVISIIGILASLTLVSFSGSQKQTRDTERRSDLGQYRNALENYAASNSGIYPTAAAGDITSVCNGTDGALDDYLASCPADPNGTDQYQYYSLAGSEYVIWADLETSDFWQVCSNGISGASESEPTGGCNL